MTIAIMQPYFFPYIGYFQLMNVVDTWVNMDHATFINKGFMHRNTIAGNQIIRLPLSGASQNLNTREIKVDYESNQLRKLLKTLEHHYGKAPYFKVAKMMLERNIAAEPDSLAAFNWLLINQIHDYLDMDTKLVESSLGLTMLKKADAMIDIANQFQADKIINPIGGSQLYDKDYFRNRGVSIDFIRMTATREEDRLSIIHLICNYPAEVLKERLTECELL